MKIWFLDPRGLGKLAVWYINYDFAKFIKALRL